REGPVPRSTPQDGRTSAGGVVRADPGMRLILSSAVLGRCCGEHPPGLPFFDRLESDVDYLARKVDYAAFAGLIQVSPRDFCVVSRQVE
ncbi:hypothetical protein, partial [Streptomyces sp. DSM 41634]|uniref:hypothetical protein n=1 Tax=Streptomyces sp. DSM 41634 TaxID=3448656 RepID=UPI00403FDC76